MLYFLFRLESLSFFKLKFNLDLSDTSHESRFEGLACTKHAAIKWDKKMFPHFLFCKKAILSGTLS